VTEVIVVQHGDKEPLPGDPGLTLLGHAQAVATASFLAGSAVPPVVLCSSPALRARETAASIAEQLGVDVGIDARLRERMNWEGPAVESLDAFLAEWRLTTVDREVVPSSGDSSNDAADRFLDAIDDLVDRHPAGTVVVVSHGGVTTDALRTVLGDRDLLRRAPRLVDEGVPSCGLTRMIRDTVGWTVPAIASTRHLEQLEQTFPD
jgi:broad specificity phosphatase PhoE